MSEGMPLEVKVWGAFACFTRPEFGVERVSYEVMTPSAARGVLEAIFWKPEFRWRVREIRVLPTAKRDSDGEPLSEPEHHIKHYSILRNEMNSVQSDRAARGWEHNGGGYFADDDRAQRHTLCLRDVAYMIRADMELRSHATDDVAKYRDQFRRRVKRGQCFTQPYLGTREFSAFFGVPDSEDPMRYTDDLGLVLFDVAFEEAGNGAVKYAAHGAGGREYVSGDAKPVFFQARIEDGVVEVPPDLYEGDGS
ncbi:MAG: type I-C CRISPR-associated protein Cas5c [Actinomycetota bacterium]|jgi:CRISPR-associated protein Cas5d|nr:type I-C CRISPR-associated protein Cas5c [Actinomycetota bacterium]